MFNDSPMDSFGGQMAVMFFTAPVLILLIGAVDRFAYDYRFYVVAMMLAAYIALEVYWKLNRTPNDTI